MTVADRIIKRRTELGYTQDELAKMCGYASRTSICKIETSGDEVSMKKLKKIAEHLSCTPASLMGWEIDTYDNSPEYIKKFSTLQNEDAELLELYHSLNDSQKGAVLTFLKTLIVK